MFRLLRILFHVLRYCIHIIVFLRSKNKEIIEYEIIRWNESHHLPNKNGIKGLINLLASYPEYRSLFYLRTGISWLSFLAKGQTNLEFYTESHNIGKGLIIWHGFSTVINVKSMGKDCQVWQNVVIGKKSSDDIDDRPIIGDNVLISASSNVIGPIEIGSNVTIGAGTTVAKSIVPNSIVVGASPRILVSEITNKIP